MPIPEERVILIAERVHQRLQPMGRWPCKACIAETRRALSFLRLGTTMPSAATTSPRARIGTPTEQAPRLIYSTVVA